MCGFAALLDFGSFCCVVLGGECQCLGVTTDPGNVSFRLCFNWRPMWGLPLLGDRLCFRGLQVGGKSVRWFGGRFRGPVCHGAVLAAATGGSDVTEFAGWLRSHRGFGVLCWSGGCVGRWPEIELIDTRVGPIVLRVCAGAVAWWLSSAQSVSCGCVVMGDSSPT